MLLPCRIRSTSEHSLQAKLQQMARYHHIL
jgi:hypothetical protein